MDIVRVRIEAMELQVVAAGWTMRMLRIGQSGLLREEPNLKGKRFRDWDEAASPKQAPVTCKFMIGTRKLFDAVCLW